MNICCLCPTYGRPPALLANTVALFYAQRYPAEQRRLLLYDDLGNVQTAGPGWATLTKTDREPNLPAKYRTMCEHSMFLFGPGWQPDAYAIWDDDDIYAPSHLTVLAKALEKAPWHHPKWVWSLYTGHLNMEPADGRFWASVGFRRSLIEQVGWPDTPRLEYDQMMLGALTKAAPPYRNTSSPTFCMRWHSTQARHASAQPEGTWYQTPPQYSSIIQRLDPALDAETLMVGATVEELYQARKGD